MPSTDLPDGHLAAEPFTRALATLRGRGHTAATIATHSGLNPTDIRAILNGRRVTVRSTTAAKISKAWQELKDRPPQPLASVDSRRQVLDAADQSGRSSRQVAALTGLSVRTVKRRRTARRTAGQADVQAAA